MTGSATNAEDFTKQFMSEMFGNGAQIPQNQVLSIYLLE